MPYSGDPSASALDSVRFLLGDTDPNDVLLQDEEITWLLANWNDDAYDAAAAGAEQLAGQFAKEVSYVADGVQVGTTELQQKYLTLAQRLRSLGRRKGRTAGPYAGGISRTDVDQVLASQDEIRTAIGMGMHDNVYEGGGSYVDADTAANQLLSNQGREYGGVS